MQELTAPPQTTSPYTPMGGSNMPSNTPPNAPQPPRLGTPVPGTTGGLPASPGLSVHSNPLSQQLQPQQAAQQVQQYGRGQDSMLVHMTPDEVNSLRGLAQRFGGDLSVNPNTGLPEAGFLGKLLPTLLGGLGMAFGIPPVWMGAAGALGGTIATGDLGKGLMMGLNAYGGASLAGAAGIGSKFGTLGTKLGLPGADKLAGIGAKVASPVAEQAIQAPLPAVAKGTPFTEAFSTLGAPSTANAVVPGAVDIAALNAPKAGLLSNFGQYAKAGLPGGIAQKVAPMAAGLGVLNAVTPGPAKVYADKEKPSEYGYTGPYRVAGDRVLQNAPMGTNEVGIATSPQGRMTSAEQLYFNPTTSYTDSMGQAWTPGQKTTPITNVGTSGKPKWVYESEMDRYVPKKQGLFGAIGMQDAVDQFRQRGGMYAEGGEVFHMESGGHVFPAKAVAAFGNFDTEAGQRKLAKMGGVPIKGPGDGVSDSIPARIDGGQEARVATGEVYFPPKAVKRMGGNQKLYAMMRKAEQAANRTKSGDKVKGLGALA